MSIPKTSELERVYGDAAAAEKRFAALAENYAKNFGEGEVEFFTAPGRTEIIGNHTDGAIRITLGNVDPRSGKIRQNGRINRSAVKYGISARITNAETGIHGIIGPLWM